jgi:hypothetical protein
MGAPELLQRLSRFGAAAQASVPGAYAWGVTVAPAAWGRGGSLVAKLAAIVALLALAASVAGERWWGARGRLATFWTFVLASALTWSAAPLALAPLRIDAPRGVAGMLGWALFAFASAAPALQGKRESERLVDEEPLAARRGLARWDAAYVTLGAVAAAALQVVGWHVATAERALLVRFVTVAAGVALLGATTEVALARHAPRVARSRTRRLRGAMAAFVVLGLLGLTGVLFGARP